MRRRLAVSAAAIALLSLLPLHSGASDVDYTWFHRMMRPEQAPPLNRPVALRAARAPLRPTDRVVGLRLNGRARAYPLGVLAYHRVINDRLAGRRIAVAHAPLSGATLCAATEADLHHSGALYESDALLGDAATGDLWSVLRGESLLGPRVGQALRRLPCHVMTWSAWRRSNPKTTLAWSHRPPRGFDYRRDPWAWYRSADEHLAAPVHLMDLRLPRKREVLGLVHGGRARAFPLSSDRADPPQVINTEVGGLAAAVLLHPRSGHAAAFARGTRKLGLTSAGAELIDARDGTRWDLLGRCQRQRGPCAHLTPAPGGRAYFFAWAAHHPGTTIHQTAIKTAIKASIKAPTSIEANTARRTK